MAITTAQKNKLNKMNRASQDVGIGTLLQKIDGPFSSGSHTVTATEINASAIYLETGQTSITGFIVQRYMSGSQISDIKVVSTGSNLNITAGSGSALATGDVIYWTTF